MGRRVGPDPRPACDLSEEEQSEMDRLGLEIRPARRSADHQDLCPHFYQQGEQTERCCAGRKRSDANSPEHENYIAIAYYLATKSESDA